MAGWGWAELTGTNATEQMKWASRNWFNTDLPLGAEESDTEGANTPTRQGHGDQVPQPSENATQEDEGAVNPESPKESQFLVGKPHKHQDEVKSRPGSRTGSKPGSQPESPSERPGSPLTGFFNFFKPSLASKPQSNTKVQAQDTKQSKIYKRGQTIKAAHEVSSNNDSTTAEGSQGDRPGMARGDSALGPDSGFAPPKTSVFEAAGDLLNPPIPSKEFLTDPSSRPRTIFHDRIYHPSDIPPPPTKSRGSIRRRYSIDGRDSRSSTKSSMSIESASSTVSEDTSTMKVEEKIARAYHRDLSWRKVLVRLEPDAHNNIVVRRMFSNAYGWPVIKHLVDTHFSDSYTARTADKQEPNTERAMPMTDPVGDDGKEVKDRPKPRSSSMDEQRDTLGDLTASASSRPRIVRHDSADWDDRFFNTDEDDSDDEVLSPPRSPRLRSPARPDGSKGTSSKELDDFLGKMSKKEDDTKAATTTNSLVLPIITQSPPRTSTLGLRTSLEELLRPEPSTSNASSKAEADSNANDGNDNVGTN